MFQGLKIESADGVYLFEDGNGFEASEWREDIANTPKPVTQYTIGGVPKRSVPPQRFTVAVNIVFSSYDEYKTFHDFYYESSIDYLFITFSNNPPSKSTNILAMAFVDELVYKNLMGNSIEVTFTIEEVPHIFES